MSYILIIDDDKALCRVMSDIVTRMGHEAISFYSLEDGVSHLESGKYDVVLLDVKLPDGNGLDMIPRIMNSSSQPDVIIITGNGDPNGAELAIKHKAWDYLEKPVSLKVIKLTLSRVLEYRKEKSTRKRVVSINRDRIIGNSHSLNICLDTVANSSLTDNNVLITGETGTGKEIFSQVVHENSSRSRCPLVVVDCAALPENLVESMLFGHIKGSFTGADKDRAGLICQADGGTLFLDEIGELPLSLQKAFLRVLQERKFRPVGSSVEEKSDFRLICATNRNLEKRVREGKFRQDLLYRIRTTVISLPPLRERVRDVKTLATFFMTRFCDRLHLTTKGFSPDFIEALEQYYWPGNVRELENCIMTILTDAGNDPVLYAKHLPVQIRVDLARNHFKTSREKHSENETGVSFDLPLKSYKLLFVDKAEKEYLQNLVTTTDWNIKKACSQSGLSRPRLYALLKKHTILRN